MNEEEYAAAMARLSGENQRSRMDLSRQAWNRLNQQAASFAGSAGTGAHGEGATGDIPMRYQGATELAKLGMPEFLSSMLRPLHPMDISGGVLQEQGLQRLSKSVGNALREKLFGNKSGLAWY
jgi:hypothetical protein